MAKTNFKGLHKPGPNEPWTVHLRPKSASSSKQQSKPSEPNGQAPKK